MSNLKPISHQDIIDAIQRIDNNSQLKKQRGSSTYDLVYNGRSYPPILVLSEANKVCGGGELLLSDFGNSTEKAFKILRELGFIVIMKRKLAFKEYLLTTTPEGSGTSSSYLQAMDNLDELFNESGRINGSIYNIEDINFFEQVVEDVKLYQKDNESILYKKPKSYAERGFYSASVRKYIEFLLESGLNSSLQKDTSKKVTKLIRHKDQGYFTIKAFSESLNNANLSFSEILITRFVTSLITKPFVLLNGLSGSGKTKLAQSFVQWICQDNSQYKIIPVGADWTNREPLLGYPNGLDPENYITPDNGALQLMLDAQSNPELPYFMILDEMNLSHVERYFADFLSVMESNDSIKLYTGNKRKDSRGYFIPERISWPENLFIIGTVNIDETTYMFSPKVLDRANVIEFRIEEKELRSYFENIKSIDLTQLEYKGISTSKGFLSMCKLVTKSTDKVVQEELVKFFIELSKVGSEFGYRTANEALTLIQQLGKLDSTMELNQRIDIAIMQKLLPKLHGSRSKIVKVLDALILLCVKDANSFDINKVLTDDKLRVDLKYPISYAKLLRMYNNVIANGFTSYAEA
ncbi:McrB family protein [Myroides phaeus]|uniref:ScoMcrA-like N-terminal head domain-containing protein n=1 Tax=Myroides phaeus TaxID=702745 RepID=A0A1G8EDZ5_9FLAO|nr:hypothetical protein [Myroides phaeus]SDH68117.1 hypothetical protein SAMN05421818_11067 [Myroides phaeus]